MVFHNENLRSVSRILRGIEISDETLALDVINEIGPEGHFLSHGHTLKHFRKELFFPKLFDRTDFEGFEKGPMKNLSQRSYEMASELLATHEPAPLDKDFESELDNITKRIKKMYVGSKFY